MKLDLPTLVYRRNRGDAIEGYKYKYLHGTYDVDSTDLLPRHVEWQQGVIVWSWEKPIRANFFGVRVVNLWNSLPEELVSSATVNCFKGRFDRDCLVNRFSEEWIMNCSSDKRETADTSLWEDQATCLLHDWRRWWWLLLLYCNKIDKQMHKFGVMTFRLADNLLNFTCKSDNLGFAHISWLAWIAVENLNFCAFRN